MFDPGYFLIIPLILIFIVLTLFLLSKQRQFYWFRHGVFTYEKSYQLLGSFWKSVFLGNSLIDRCSEIYMEATKDDHPVVGVSIYARKGLFICNYTLATDFLFKDKSYFGDGHSSHIFEQSLNSTLFAKMHEFESYKQTLATILTQVNLNIIFEMISKVGRDLNEKIRLNATENQEVTNLVTNFVVEVISRVFYGLEPGPNALQKHKNEVFKTRFWKLNWLIVNFEKFNRKHLTWSRPFVWKDRILADLNGRWKEQTDVIDMLDNYYLRGFGHNITINDLISFAEIFTTQLRLVAPTMVFALHEMARNKRVQEKLQTELNTILENNNGKLTMNYIMAFDTYLHKVIQETLRLYPIEAIAKRECNFPENEDERYTLEPCHTFIVPKNMSLIIPVLAINKDSRFFPNAQDFDPERFSDPVQAKKFLGYKKMRLDETIEAADKIALMEAKIFLCSILRTFEVQTQMQDIPFRNDSAYLLPKGKVHMQFKALPN